MLKVYRFTLLVRSNNVIVLDGLYVVKGTDLNSMPNTKIPNSHVIFIYLTCLNLRFFDKL